MKPIARSTRGVAPGLLALALALAIPATAFGQATRTWVSGVGDDANPCSRTAPCKTFAGAISKTATGGEINVLDPGGFGAVTITKSITISSAGFEAGVLVSGTNGIVINAPGANVILRGLDFEGLGTGLDGVLILNAANVRVENSTINDFSHNGIELATNSTVTKLEVNNTDIYNNAGDGIIVDPNGSGQKGKATLFNDTLENNNCGVVADAYDGSGGIVGTGANCGTSSGTGAGAIATITAFGLTIADNVKGTDTTSTGSSGILAQGASSTVRIANDNVVANINGLSEANGGTITSFGNNNVIGNTTDGAPTPPNASQSSVGRRSHHRATKGRGSTKHRSTSRHRT